MLFGFFGWTIAHNLLDRPVKYIYMVSFGVDRSRANTNAVRLISRPCLLPLQCHKDATLETGMFIIMLFYASTCIGKPGFGRNEKLVPTILHFPALQPLPASIQDDPTGIAYELLNIVQILMIRNTLITFIICDGEQDIFFFQ